MPAGPSRTQSELRILGIMAIVVLSLAVGAAIYGLIQRAAGRSELGAVRQRLEANGTLRPFSEIVPPASKEVIKNGRDLLASVVDLRALLKKNPSLQEQPSAVRVISPGIVIATDQESTPAFDSRPTAARPGSWKEYRLLLGALSSVFTESHEILQKPVDLRHEYEKFEENDSLEGIYDLIALLRWEAILRLHDQDTSGAIDDLSSMTQPAHFVGSRRTIRYNGYEMGEWHAHLGELFWAILQARSLTDADLLRLNKIASQTDFAAQTLTTLEIEIASVPYFYPLVELMPPSSLRWAFGGSPHWLFGTDSAISLRRSLWLYLWSDSDQAQTLSRWAGAVDKMRELIRSRNWKTIAPRFTVPNDSLPSADQRGFPIARRAYLDSVISDLFRSTLLAETRRQLILTVVALERYRLRNSHYPDTLAQLVPAFLPALPSDWFDGTALKYRLLSNGQFLLYSVGENCLDDGGDATRPDMQPETRDIVWPRLKK